MRDRPRSWLLDLVDRLQARGEVPRGLGEQFRRNMPLYITGTVMLLLQNWLMAVRDFLVRDAIDAIAAQADAAAAKAAVLILVVSVVAMIGRLASRITIFTGGRNVEYELRAELLKHLHRLGPSFFGKVPTGDIMSRATNDLQQVRLLLGFGILNVVSSAFALVSALYVMVAVSWKLTLAALATFPLLMIIMRYFSQGFYSRTRSAQQAIGHMSDRVLASLAGVRVVRSFAMEESEIAAFERANKDYLQKSLSLARLRGSMGPVVAAVSATGVLIVFWYGGHLLATQPGFTPGDFTAFWLALQRLVWPMMAIGFVTAIVQRGRAGYDRLKAVYDTEPDISDGDRPAPEHIRGEVAVKGITFAYGQRKVLDGVSFEVPAGSSLAIVGRTGSGKTTIAALLPRLLPTEPGTVFLDGHDVCDLPLQIVRASIGYAQQDAFLFSTTVARNIGYALDDPDAERALVESAAREAQVDSDIARLPDGYETVVGERGVQLSGGQKQRVALARALIREPPVLVLDDPLSAVDARTEAAILQAIDRQKARRTVILITHRVAAAQRCDQVIVIEKGKVLEHGSHEELIAAGGIYALFAEEQQMEKDLAAISARSVPAPSRPESPEAAEAAQAIRGEA